MLPERDGLSVHRSDLSPDLVAVVVFAIAVVVFAVAVAVFLAVAAVAFVGGLLHLLDKFKNHMSLLLFFFGPYTRVCVFPRPKNSRNSACFFFRPFFVLLFQFLRRCSEVKETRSEKKIYFHSFIWCFLEPDEVPFSTVLPSSRALRRLRQHFSRKSRTTPPPLL